MLAADVTYLSGVVELAEEIIEHLHQLVDPQLGGERGEVNDVRVQDGHHLVPV